MHSFLGAVKKFIRATEANPLCPESIEQAAEDLKKSLSQNESLRRSERFAALEQSLLALSLTDRARSAEWLNRVDALKKEVEPFSNLFEFIGFSSSPKSPPNKRYEMLQKCYEEIFLARPYVKERENNWQFADQLIRSQDDFHWKKTIKQHLTWHEKDALQNAYYNLMCDRYYGSTFFESVKDIVQLIIKALLSKIKSDLEQGVINVDQANARLIKVYNHFCLLVTHYAPMHLLHVSSTFFRTVEMLFPEGHSIYSTKSKIPLAQSPERKELIKFLLLQQIVMTAGTAFREGRHLDLALCFLAEHQKWWGRLLNRWCGYETASMKLYRDYQKTLDVNVTQARKQELTEIIRDKIQIRTKRLRRLFSEEESLLLEAKFPGAASIHSQGFSFAELLRVREGVRNTPMVAAGSSPVMAY